MISRLLCLIGVSLSLLPLHAQQPGLLKETFMVDGVTREALLYVPAKAKTEASPLIFGWHGHGGSMNNTSRSYHFHELWPEAIVVYAQGLNTPGRLTDPDGKKPGWQGRSGDQGDRDLKFFDAMWKTLHERYKIDDKRIYSSGHSNGGGFTYLLWATRGDRFTAMAPSAAAATATRDELKPKPVLHVAGENDPLVKYAWQKATMEALRKLNQCGEGKPWDLDKNCTFYPSAIGAPVITAIHPGTHNYPKEAPAVIVKFFKSQVAK
jgi:polyhydroxybutyrate depolymerase